MERLGIGDFKNVLSGTFRWSTATSFTGTRFCATDKLLLLDEPVTGLDPLVTEELYQLIEQLNRDLGVTIIMVSHDISSATQYADKILHISQSLLFYGDTESYINTELGKRFLKCS
ncbi:MAG: AAA family ATPase [Acutalibacteraceae bacterium]